MLIKIVKGAGEASTPLSAFDGALNDAGVCNYNLITLSSVIPPNSVVERTTKFKTPESEWGYKLYCVMAEERCNEAGKFIAAGIGWYQLEDRRGLFVEHHLIGDTRVAVESELLFRIKNSLKDLCKFRDIDWEDEKMQMEVSIDQVKSHPASVLVMAIYQSEGWK
jgi:arginine decarboxylase